MRYTPSQAFQLVKGYSPNPKSWRPVVYNAELGDALLLMDFATAPTGARWKEESELLVDQTRQSSPASPTTSCKEQATWCERAEAVYLAVVVHVVPMDRKRIRFFGHPLARNEVIAAILTICTNRPWDRKQVSSHHQQLKSKQHIPADLRSLFTTEDSRSSGGASRASLIEDFVFHPDLLAIMDLPGGTDVAHAKLHPRLDHWYRGEATAPESKKGSTSPKRRRTSESSGSLLLTSSTTSSSTRPQRPAKKAPIPRATRISQRNVGATAVSQVADSPATSYAITFSSEGGCFPSRHTRAQSPAQARDAGRSSSPKASAHVQAAPKIPLSDLLNDPGTPNK